MFQFTERKIKVQEYIDLRKSVHWGIPDHKAIENGLENSIYSVCASAGDETIGIARVIGDGSICFYIQDVIVKPQFQRNSVGSKLMEKVMGFIEINAAKGAIVGLMASKGYESFYEKYGFWKRPNEHFGHGMMKFWNID